MLISFLSSLFFNFPGASAMGREVWKMKSLPAHSAACRKASAKAEVRNIYKNCKGNCDSRTSVQASSLLHFSMSGRHSVRHIGSVSLGYFSGNPTQGAQLTGQLQNQLYWTCASSMAGRKGLSPRKHRAVCRTQLQQVTHKCLRLLSSLTCSYRVWERESQKWQRIL